MHLPKCVIMPYASRQALEKEYMPFNRLYTPNRIISKVFVYIIQAYCNDSTVIARRQTSPCTASHTLFEKDLAWWLEWLE